MKIEPNKILLRIRIPSRETKAMRKIAVVAVSRKKVWSWTWLGDRAGILNPRRQALFDGGGVGGVGVEMSTSLPS